MTSKLADCRWRTDAPPQDRPFLAYTNRSLTPVICIYCDLEDAYTWAMHTITPDRRPFFAQSGRYHVTCVGGASEIKAWIELPRYRVDGGADG